MKAKDQAYVALIVSISTVMAACSPVEPKPSVDLRGTWVTELKSNKAFLGIDPGSYSGSDLINDCIWVPNIIAGVYDQHRQDTESWLQYQSIYDRCVGRLEGIVVGAAFAANHHENPEFCVQSVLAQSLKEVVEALVPKLLWMAEGGNTGTMVNDEFTGTMTLRSALSLAYPPCPGWPDHD